MQVTDPTLILRHGNRTTSPSSSAATTTSSGSTATSFLSSNPSIVARQASSSAAPSQTTAIPQLLATIANNTANQVPYVWNFGVFLGIAGVLFFASLLLPLVGPNLLRIVVQRTYKLRNWAVFWPFVFAFYYVSVYWMIPEIMQAHLGCTGGEDGGCADGEGDYFYLYNFKTSGNDAINTVTYVLSAVVMGAIGLTQLALAVMYRKGALVTCTWIGFAAVVIAVYFADYYGSIEEDFVYPISTGLSLFAILPMVYLLAVWSTPQVWDLWAEHAEKKRRRTTTTKELAEDEGQTQF